MIVSTPQPTRPIRRDKRTTELKGTGADAGQYFECWNCGFRCKIGRDTLGTERDGSGATFLDYTHAAPGPSESGRPVSIMPVMYGLNMTIVGLPLGADGQPKAPQHRLAVSGTGCPFCHTKNWK